MFNKLINHLLHKNETKEVRFYDVKNELTLIHYIYKIYGKTWEESIEEWGNHFNKHYGYHYDVFYLYETNSKTMESSLTGIELRQKRL